MLKNKTNKQTKKRAFYVLKKVYIQLIVLWKSFHEDWAWGNDSFGKFSWNLSATHISHSLDVSTLHALFSVNNFFHFPVCSCAVDLCQNIFFLCDSSSFLRESAAYSIYSKSIYPGKYLDMWNSSKVLRCLSGQESTQNLWNCKSLLGVFYLEVLIGKEQ